MKLGMPTLIELPDINKTIDLCDELGLSFIELNMNIPDFCPEHLSPDLVKKISEDKNIEFTLHLPEEIDLASFHPPIRQGNLERCCEAIIWASQAEKFLRKATSVEVEKMVYNLAKNNKFNYLPNPP